MGDILGTNQRGAKSVRPLAIGLTTRRRTSPSCSDCPQARRLSRHTSTLSASSKTANSRASSVCYSSVRTRVNDAQRAQVQERHYVQYGRVCGTATRSPRVIPHVHVPRVLLARCARALRPLCYTRPKIPMIFSLARQWTLTQQTCTSSTATRPT